MESNRLEFLTTEERRTVETSTETGFIADFEEWAAMKTDASKYGLKAAALQALSLSAGDVVTLPSMFSDDPVYMNLYILLVGASTTMRKTTILGYVRSILPRNEQNGQHFVRYMDDVSIQAFNKEMAEAGLQESPILMSMDEIAGMFEISRTRNSYLRGFDKTLLKAYDHSPIHIARTSKKINVPTGAFVNLFAASTPEPLVEVLNSDDIESGLLPRFIIFDVRDAMRGKRVPLGDRLKNHDEWIEKKESLQRHLAEIAASRASGTPAGIVDFADGRKIEFEKTTIPLTDEAVDRLDVIDAEFSKTAGMESSALAAIKGRAFWHIFKLAGIYALSRDGIKAQVELIDVLRAASLVEETASDLLQMKEEVGSNLLERRINEVGKLLKSVRSRSMKQSTVMRRLRLSNRDVAELAQTMLMRRQIETKRLKDGDHTWKWIG